MRFGTAEEKAFARDLVQRLVKELPPNDITTRRQVLSVNKITRELEKAYQNAAAYQRENRIGFIRRAVLANTFKWELKASGYPDEFIDVATEGLVFEISKVSRAPAAK
jgi:hypothetical protein